MGSTEENVATTALVIAILALSIAVGQFTQQIFGTAEGYRRCQDSVIGPWARLTRLSWRWQGFRCETKFTAPVILFSNQEVEDIHLLGNIPEYTPPSRSQRSARKIRRWIQRLLRWIKYYVTHLFSGKRLEHKPTPLEEEERVLWDTIRLPEQGEESSTKYTYRADSVTWMPLLRAIYKSEKDVGHVPSKDHPAYGDGVGKNVGLTPTFAAVSLVERSWDLIPADVVRPFAQTTVGAMITLADRLGMQWQSFNPYSGTLNAQGNGHVISSNKVRGLGILCEYRLILGRHKSLGGGPRESAVSHVFIGGCKELDMFRCGIIPSSIPSIEPIHLVGGNPTDLSLIRRFLDTFHFKDDIQETVLSQATFKPTEDERTPRLFQDVLGLVLSELIGIIAPFLPMYGSMVSNVPWPVANRRVLAAGLFWESRAALLFRLGDLVARNPSQRLKRILEGMQKVETEFPHHFYCRWHRVEEMEREDSHKKADLIKFCRGEHAWTSEELFPGNHDNSSEDNNNSQPYKRLLDWHLDMAARSLRGVVKRKKHKYPYVGDGQPHGPKTTEWALELGERYVEHYVEALQGRETPFNDVDGELWWVMVYRSFCWYLSVKIDRGQNPLPSMYYGSDMPVYIG